jgi:hypothetical protein
MMLMMLMLLLLPLMMMMIIVMTTRLVMCQGTEDILSTQREQITALRSEKEKLEQFTKQTLQYMQDKASRELNEGHSCTSRLDYRRTFIEAPLSPWDVLGVDSICRRWRA